MGSKIRGVSLLPWLRRTIFPHVQNGSIRNFEHFRGRVLEELPSGHSQKTAKALVKAIWDDATNMIKPEYLGQVKLIPPPTIDNAVIRIPWEDEPFEPGLQGELPMVAWRNLKMLDTAVPKWTEHLEHEYLEEYEMQDQDILEAVEPGEHEVAEITEAERLERLVDELGDEVLLEEDDMDHDFDLELGDSRGVQERAFETTTGREAFEGYVQAVDEALAARCEGGKSTHKAKLEEYEAALKQTNFIIEEAKRGRFTSSQIPILIGKACQYLGTTKYKKLMEKLKQLEKNAKMKTSLSSAERSNLSNLGSILKSREIKGKKAERVEKKKAAKSAREEFTIEDRMKKLAVNVASVFGKSGVSQEIALGMKMDPVDNWRDLATEGLTAPRMVPSIEDQSFLIGEAALSRGFDKSHRIANSPLLSDDVIETANDALVPKVPQFSLMGTTSVGGETKRLFTNANVPFSAFICGLQGSGKSHTLSCMLENFMVPEPKLGCLQKPLPALVFQFSPHSHSSFRPCEAGYLGKPPLPTDPLPTTVKSVRSVRILVSASNYANMKAAYASIPNASVSALRFRPKDLTIGSMLQLMAVGTSTSNTPLYMHRVTQILRDMATMKGGAFDYLAFKRKLGSAGLNREQASMLNMRLELLESFLGDDDTASQFSVEPGVLTLIDLSCPFVDPETACALFSISMDFYLTASGASAKGGNRGLVVALDEAHKYITNSPAAAKFTDSLLALIRQQRHYGARVIISTQEPTVSPRLLDLCSMTVCHRFTSPEWFRTLRKHVNVQDEEREDVFNRIIELNVGQALVFAPTAVVKPPVADDGSIDGVTRFDIEEADDDDAIGEKRMKQRKVSRGEMEAKGILELSVRKRITFDGGRSIVSMDPAAQALEQIEELELEEEPDVEEIEDELEEQLYEEVIEEETGEEVRASGHGN